MSRLRTAFSGLAVFAACALPLAGCSGTPGAAQNAHADQQQQQLDALKSRYKDVIMGTDAQGQTLAVYVDVNALDSMDEPVEDTMKADALARWKRAWRQANPGKHGNLRVVLRDYYGNELFSETARV